MSYEQVQTCGPETHEVGCTATTYDIEDTYIPPKEEPRKLIKGLAPVQMKSMGVGPGAGSDTKSVGTSVSRSVAKSQIGKSMGTRSVAIQDFSIYSVSQGAGMRAGRAGPGGETLTPEMVALNSLLTLESFRVAVETVERAVINNTMHDLQMKYRAQDGALKELIAHLNEPASNPDQANLEEIKDAAPDEKKLKEAASAAQGDEKKAAPGLDMLWCFEPPNIAGRQVTSMVWNTKNPDLLAVGYGSLVFGNQKKGLILFWSIKNPRHPSKSIEVPSGVVSMDFSQDNPNLLAAGLYNGSVLIYDVREPGNEPALKSVHEKGKKTKHSEAVWAVRWVTTGGPGHQLLTSIAGDGTVLLWNLKKGLEPKQIMQLKRVTNTLVLQGSSKVDVISREASALCIDFFKNDKAQNLYIAGTEDGLVHKCSVLYSEQTLENYMAHTGPVYAVRCSPYVTDLFLTCSADESVALWDHKQTKPLLELKKDKDKIQGLAWAPFDSCVFASISRDASLKVWDLSSSTMNPLISVTVPAWDPRPDVAEGEAASKLGSRPESPGYTASAAGSPNRPASPATETGDFKNELPPPELTCVEFAPNSPVVLVGGNDGIVRVYRITNVNAPKSPRDEKFTQTQVERLTRASGMVIPTKV
uniref:Dynein axonemal intermediate chain 4 n=1 Tax=Lotharella globosa TaxID=91324 RepID=A0A7S3ZFE6_9EUKA